MKALLKSFFIIFTLTASNFAYSQVKILSNGNVGINQTSPIFKLDVNGNTRLNGYVGINGSADCCYPLKITSAYGQIFMFDPSNIDNGGIIGSSTDKINFWYSVSTGYNKLYAQSYSVSSDSTLKKNIKTLNHGALQKVLNLRPVSYDFKNEKKVSDNTELKEIGLLAQEVGQVIPEAVSFSEVSDIMMIDYNMIIPVLIKAIQEQEDLIETLQKRLKKIENENNINKKKITDETERTNYNSASLDQNSPNPFSKNTEIKYYIPETSITSLLYVYNMNGVQIKSFKITEKGNGHISINSSELNPGMYLYSLIIDGREVDTKRMILTE